MNDQLALPIQQLAVERCVANGVTSIRNGDELIMADHGGVDELSTYWVVAYDIAKIDHASLSAMSIIGVLLNHDDAGYSFAADELHHRGASNGQADFKSTVRSRLDSEPLSTGNLAHNPPWDCT